MELLDLVALPWLAVAGELFGHCWVVGKKNPSVTPFGRATSPFALRENVKDLGFA
jgi:hypothetical protein